MLLLNVEVHFIEDISKAMQNATFSELPHTLIIYGGNIDVSFVLRSKRTLVNSSSSVFSRTSSSLLHTFVADTLPNFPMPFDIILTYTNKSPVNGCRRPLVFIHNGGIWKVTIQPRLKNELNEMLCHAMVSDKVMCWPECVQPPLPSGKIGLGSPVELFLNK